MMVRIQGDDDTRLERMIASVDPIPLTKAQAVRAAIRQTEEMMRRDPKGYRDFISREILFHGL